MSRGMFAALGLVVYLSFPFNAFAWNDAGHMTVARIAWDALSVDERDAVVAVLKKHPHVDALLLKDRPDEANPDEWIFLRASVWADYVRPGKDFPRDDIPGHPLYKFHRGIWHYVNFPYEMGQHSDQLPVKSLPVETNILEQLDRSMEVLTGKASQDNGRVAGVTDDENRAVRLTWLFHLLGDLHQPFHAVALIDKNLFPDPPHGDQGGNKLAVRADANAKPKNLHWFWDEMFSTESQFDRVRQHAERLTHDPGLLPEQLPELQLHPTFREWAAESYAAAKIHGYQDGRLKLVLWDDFNAGRIPASDIPMLPSVALQQAQQLAQRRIAVAGHRLTMKLKEIIHAKQ